MSLLNVPCCRLPAILSSPTCSLTRPYASSTPLTGIRRNPCATPPWGGMSGHLATPIPDTSYEPKFCIDVSSEHMPINLAATIATAEDLDVPRQFWSFKQQQALRSSKQGSHLSKQSSLGNNLTKVLADNDSVDSRYSIRASCADSERETVVSTLFRSESKGKRDRDQNVVQSLRDRGNLHKNP